MRSRIAYAALNEKQARYIRESARCWLNVAEGGKRAGKNITNLLAWADCIERHPYRLHLAAGVSLGTAKMNILDSKGCGICLTGAAGWASTWARKRCASACPTGRRS